MQYSSSLYCINSSSFETNFVLHEWHFWLDPRGQKVACWHWCSHFLVEHWRQMGNSSHVLGRNQIGKSLHNHFLSIGMKYSQRARPNQIMKNRYRINQMKVNLGKENYRRGGRCCWRSSDVVVILQGQLHLQTLWLAFSHNSPSPRRFVRISKTFTFWAES